MRLRWLACGVFLSGALGCGSSPGGTLFAGSGKCSAGTSVECVGSNSCAGHAICGPQGQTGTCFCDNTQGSGGTAASGGVTGEGGVIGSGGVAGFSNTGGFPVSTGGFVGLPDGSIGSGGEGGVASTCPVGHFSGSYAGTYGGLLTMTQVGGNIEFTVDADGSVTGTYMGTNPNNNSKADLVGTLDCSTFELTMNVENGTYPSGVFGGTVRFSGTMPGTYTPDTRSFSGTWSLSDTNSQTGKGTWTAQ